MDFIKDIFEKIKTEVDKNLKDMKVFVDDISFETEGTYKFLRIVLDKPGGLDLDTIVEASNIINPLIDKYDMEEENYILDILSKEIGDVNNG